jgi:hypothetical protein
LRSECTPGMPRPRWPARRVTCQCAAGAGAAAPLAGRARPARWGRAICSD